MFYEFRPYDPPSGRWLTRDPLGEAGGLNLYAFVGNNPVNYVDPHGESATAGAVAGSFVCGPPCTLAGALIGLGAGGIIGILIVDAMHNDAVEDENDTCPVEGDSSDEELADRIASGHAQDHGRVDENDLAELIKDTIQRGEERKLDRERTAYYDDLTGRIVIVDPNHRDGGTTFRPRRGRQYFDDLK